VYVTHPETQKKQVLPAGARGHGLADEEVAEITGGGGVTIENREKELGTLGLMG